MCSFAAAGIAFQAFGVIQSFLGAQAEAKTAKSVSEFNAAVARNNAIIAERQAAAATQQGELRAAQEQLKGRQLAGLQRATLAANGVVVDSGTALNLVDDTFGQAQLNAANQRAIAQREALGFSTQASNFESSAQLTLAEGSNTASALNSRATTSLLVGAGSVANKWYGYRQEGDDPFFGAIN